jgi:hypothetical protein
VVKYYDVPQRNTASIFNVTELTQVEAEVIWKKKMFDFDWPNSIQLAYITHTLKWEAIHSSKIPQNLATTQYRNPKENHHLMYGPPYTS